MKILLAIDGSAQSAAAFEEVASRQWPLGTEVELLTIVHSVPPLLLDPAFVMAAACVDTTQELGRPASEPLAATPARLKRDHTNLDAACAVEIIRAGRQTMSVRPRRAQSRVSTRP